MGRRSYKTGLARLEAYQEELQQDPILVTRLQMQLAAEQLAWKGVLIAGQKGRAADEAWRNFEIQSALVVSLSETLKKSPQIDPGTIRLLAAFDGAHRDLVQGCKRAYTGTRWDDATRRTELDREILAKAEHSRESLDEVHTRLTESNRLALEAFRAELMGDEWWILGAMLAAAILLGGLGIYLHDRWITRPVFEAQEMARHIAAGRMSQEGIEIKGNDNLSELLRCLQQLHKTIEKRDQELAKARDAELEASRGKTEFLSRISQEMRTPLVGIQGTTDLLLSTDLQPDQKDFVETLAVSSSHLVSMLEDILDIAQVDSGDFEIAEDEFDVRALFEDAIEPMVEQAHGKALELGCMIEKKVPGRLLGDPRRIRHVTNKLVSNAIKFTQRGGVMISISLLEDGEKSCQLRVDVRDTGPGMSYSKSRRIFDAIAATDSALVRTDGGLGIGLSMAKRIIDRMGGHLGFDSVEGKGSHFWFRLRLAKVEPKAAVQGAAPEAQVEGRRVLCLVDNEVGRTIFGRVMDALDLRVDWAENQMQCRLHLVQAAQGQDPYSLILLDSHVASHDLEFLAELRRDRALGDQRILLLTRPLATEERKLAEELQIDRILVKPSRELVLRETIHEEVLASQLGREAREQPTVKPFDAEILLVDDNTVNQRVGKRILEKLGCKVDLAADGRQGLEMSSKKDYDIIFMDCHMPVMDGYQTTIAIRNREEHGGQRTCIIAMTADSIQGVQESCLASGMDDYAVKPIRKEQLHDLLQKWLARETGAVVEGVAVGAGAS